MDTEAAKELKYTGRIGQTFIFLGKMFRMFILQNDWKVLPMAAVIAAMVSMAIGAGLFASMEGTLQGSFALTCVCIWNGFFNSIQSICRERAVVKREHRAGMHITSYVAAHLIYQLFLCTMQVIITIYVCSKTGVKYPEADKTVFLVKLFVTLLLITYAADILALMVSAIVRTPMTAMTVMPFLLIVQLVFAGFFSLPASLNEVSDLMISKWGVRGLCVMSDYNSLPAVVIWNKMYSSGDKIDLVNGVNLKDVLKIVEEKGQRDEVLKKLGEANWNPDYENTPENLVKCWQYLFSYTLVFAAVTIVFLEFVDRDKR